MKDHECQNKPITCAYCEAAIIASEFPRHEAACSTRTEQCPRCRKYVQKRGKIYPEQIEHEEICGRPKEVPVRTEPTDAYAYNRQMLKAQLMSEGVPEADINSMLGESPIKADNPEAQRPLPPTLFQHSDSDESTPIDQIPSIDFSHIHTESQVSQPPASSDFDISEEDRQLNDIIYKSLLEK